MCAIRKAVNKAFFGWWVDDLGKLRQEASPRPFIFHGKGTNFKTPQGVKRYWLGVKF
jgi:hypothetical protein